MKENKPKLGSASRAHGPTYLPSPGRRQTYSVARFRTTVTEVIGAVSSFCPLLRGLQSPEEHAHEMTARALQSSSRRFKTSWKEGVFPGCPRHCISLAIISLYAQVRTITIVVRVKGDVADGSVHRHTVCKLSCGTGCHLSQMSKEWGRAESQTTISY